MHYMTILDSVVLGSHFILFPFTAYLLAISIAALIARKPPRQGGGSGSVVVPQKRFMVAVPAHDEEAGIVATVRSCLALDYPTGLYQVLVIADNCSDQTALRALEAGARVIERVEPTKKSKGHAMAYVVDKLSRQGELDDVDALVVVDADSTVDPQLLKRFALGLERGDDWIQCYDTVGNAGQSWRTKLMAYGFSLINGVVLRGQTALGLSAGFRGNGMCLSTRGLRRVPWTTYGLTEDLEYSWSVRLAGGKIAYAGDVAVYATMLSQGGKPAIDQRLRWEHGRQTLKRRLIRPLLISPALSWPEKIAATIELLMPTISYLFCSYLLLTVLTLIALPDLRAQRNHPFFCYSIGFCYAISTLGLFLHAACPFLLGLMPLKYVTTLLCIPYYVVWKAAIWFRGRPATWSRTKRETSPPPRMAACNQGENARHGANC